MNTTAAYPLQVTAPANTWAVTTLAHPAVRDAREACTECLGCADSAVIHARVTGSVGATYGDGDHSATVKRVHALIDTTGL